jgi:hypothetical protein
MTDFINYEKVGMVGLLIMVVLGLVAYIKHQHAQQIKMLQKQIDQERADSKRLLSICQKMIKSKTDISGEMTMDETIHLLSEL